MQFCFLFTFVLLFCYEMSMLDVIFLRHGIMTSQWKASHLVMFLRHGIMTSQSKAFHLVNAHLTVSNLSALSNQNKLFRLFYGTRILTTTGPIRNFVFLRRKPRICNFHRHKQKIFILKYWKSTATYLDYYWSWILFIVVTLDMSLVFVFDVTMPICAGNRCSRWIAWILSLE